MHGVLVNRLGGLSLPRKSVARLTDRPDMALDVYRGRKTTMQQQQHNLQTMHIRVATGSTVKPCAMAAFMISHILCNCLILFAALNFLQCLKQ